MTLEEREKYQQIYQVARDALQEQLSRMEFLDKKAQINLVVIGIVLSLGAIRTDQIAGLLFISRLGSPINAFQLGFLLCTFLFLVISLVLSILTLMPRKLQAYPAISELLKSFKDEEIQDLHASLSEHYSEAISKNEDPLGLKLKRLKWSIVAVLVALSSLIGFFFSSTIAKIFF